MVVDLKLNRVQLIEESFYLFKSLDVTRSLLDADGYIASFNVAFNQEIYERAEYKKGWKFNYYNDPRSI
jgi:hypothetical protein